MIGNGQDTELGCMAKAIRSRARVLAELARAEDVGGGDLTGMLLAEADAVGSAALVAREPMVVAGVAIADVVLSVFD